MEGFLSQFYAIALHAQVGWGYISPGPIADVRGALNEKWSREEERQNSDSLSAQFANYMPPGENLLEI
ncbi:MAG TPA: hypothetical protein VG225_06540 [Terracidiphilus sp.]|jgi:hypothetical protein|nr:hypothetical protein [Terracidiphilus sp.]